MCGALSASGRDGGVLDPPVESARRRASLTIALVGLATAIAAVDFVQQALRWIQVNRVAGTCLVSRAAGCRVVNGTVTFAAIQRLDDRTRTLLIVDTVAVLVAGIVWLFWQHRSQRLVDERLHARDLRFTPGAVVGWWFVPIANLGIPALTMAELWRASGGADGSRVPWKDRKLPAYFGWWWSLWLVRVIAALIARGQVDDKTADFGTIQLNATLLTVAAAATVVAGILGIRLVRSVQSRLERAAPYRLASRSLQQQPPRGLLPQPAPLPWSPQRGSTPPPSPQPASTLPWSPQPATPTPLEPAVARTGAADSDAPPPSAPAAALRFLRAGRAAGVAVPEGLRRGHGRARRGGGRGRAAHVPVRAARRLRGNGHSRDAE